MLRAAPFVYPCFAGADPDTGYFKDWEKENMKNGKKRAAVFAAAFLSFLLMTGIITVPANLQTGVFAAQEESRTGEFSETVIVDPSEIKDNDELLEEYIEISLGVSNEAKYSASGAGHALTGAERTIYNALKEKVSDVAKGRHASTAFELQTYEMGLQKTSWTAQDLGLYSIFDSGNHVSEAASSAVSKKLGEEFNLSRVITSLIFDCPYDLFWYEKTEGVKMTTLFTGERISGNERIRITGITLQFIAAEDYMDPYGEFFFDGSAYLPVSVDLNKIKAANNAVAAIKSIVEANASLGDYEKLLAYRKIICDLTDYNWTASKGDAAYGNPWQLIYVFDGDPSTKVVCEGYAKAFQYLCDLSSFQSGWVESRIVSGQMLGGTGAGPHMWNVVTMNDAKNYAVDITNCDSGSVGYPDRLFLAGGKGNGIVNYTISGVSYSYDSDTYLVYEPADLEIEEKSYDPSSESAEEPPEEEQGGEDPGENVLQNGWIVIDGVRYFYIDGQREFGWLWDNGSWYYLDPVSGALKTGWVPVSGAWYYMNAYGQMQTGWVSDGGWYYMSGSGVMVTGWRQIGGVWYFFKPGGQMAANEWYGGYWLSGSGAWSYAAVGSWHQDGTGWWFGDSSGWYARNSTVMIDGVSYRFNAAGYWVG